VFEIALENSFDFLSDEYQRLFEQAHASAFQHPLWLDALYRRLAPARSAEPLVVVARRGSDGQLAMVLPLLRRRRSGLRIVEFADLEVTDYASAVCDDATFELLAQDPRMHDRLRTLFKPFDLLRIKKVPDGGQQLERLFAGARRASMGVSAHATALFEPYSDWLADKIPRSFVKELAKKRRQMNRLGALKFERLHELSAIESLLRDLQAFRGARYPGDMLGDASNFDFYRKVALTGAPTGFARAYQLSLDGRRIGGAWGLSHQRRFLMLITAFDYAAHPQRSIGFLTYEDVMRDCIAQQDAVLDFTIGDESYKQSFGAEASPLWMVSAYGTGLGVVANWVATQKVRLQPSPRTRSAIPAAAADAAPTPGPCASAGRRRCSPNPRSGQDPSSPLSPRPTRS
jgi:CelD/BcsL family acetyltransferase involved in cellulose biosynthesis